MSLPTITHNQKLKQIFILLGILLLSVKSIGQNNLFKQSEVKSSTELVLNREFTLIDPEIKVPNHFSIQPKAYITLLDKANQTPFSNRETSLELEICPVLSNGTVDVSKKYTQILKVNYTTAGVYKNIDKYVLTNSYGVKVKVKNATNVTSSVSLEIGFESERYYKMSQQLADIVGSIKSDTENIPVGLNFVWNKIPGAVEYELEWTWVDDYANGDVIVKRNMSDISFTDRDFELNNTRILTADTQYEIPLIFSRGYVLFRVRAVGRLLSNINQVCYGPWSTGINPKNLVSDWGNGVIAVPAHENLKNWQLQTSFAEQGKRKKS